MQKPGRVIVNTPLARLVALLLALLAARQGAARQGDAPPGANAVIIEPGDVRPRAGLAYTINLPLSANEGDYSDALRRSSWVLLEDSTALGPAHGTHKDVETLGRGRYSHWKNALIFSSSDGSDPRTNGRHYVLIKTADETGRRVHFCAPGAMLMVRQGDRLWWPDGEAYEMFVPRWGARRPEVNPQRPRIEGSMLVFDAPGEYGLRAAGRVARVLVLDDDAAVRPRQIVGFIAANTTGGREDELTAEESEANWPLVLRHHFDRLFQSDASLDVACGRAALLAELLCRAAGFETRYCGWIGDDPRYAAHVGLEIYNAQRGQWEYYDPHFGVAARNRADGLGLALSLQRLYAGREADAVAVLVDKMTPEGLAEQWASYGAAVQLWGDRSRSTSTVLLMNDAVPPTIEPDAFAETEFLSASRDLATFRARFYGPAIAAGGEDQR
ncbi:MAG: hypothetical protein IT430_05115 [Phycisphaerales bacterium]|nr:hypothetical protein [Phycisphaerales bacterium]